ncbi:MAG: hypothetical protein NVSMB53_18670 [Gemmatimonadaceae bacterium]
MSRTLREQAGTSGDAVLWLRTFQRIAARATHELRNAMNGAAVNLEVVRSRTTRMDPASETIGPFAEAAAGQFAATVGMVEALVTLARPARDPLDLSDYVTRLAAVLGPGLRSGGGTISVEIPRDTPVVTAAPGDLVRALVGSALLASADGASAVRCRVTATSAAIVRIERAGGVPMLDADAQAAAAKAGIGVEASIDILTLTLPLGAEDSGGPRTR